MLPFFIKEKGSARRTGEAMKQISCYTRYSRRYKVPIPPHHSRHKRRRSTA
ncbi:hypothetical protein [Pontibacter ramchanderi]|uniref:hypothetical protein n=1 Tax=Pontibacter ramchanderi TaxID=1179743 RepID=UPI0015D5C2B4|nr:hypothetical protein [Pontibacter ramchanderi]